MHKIFETGITAQHNMMPAVCDANDGMRALTCEELEQVSGGLPFLIAPLAYGAAKVFAVAFIGAIGGATGMGVYNYFTEDYEACSM